MKGEAYFKKLIANENLSATDKSVLFVLKLGSYIYAFIMMLRSIFYRLKIFRSYKLPRPVISVGNLVVGGTGKTPVTLWIARYLMQRGKKVVVLTRGYGGRLEGEVAVVADGITRLLSPADSGDEPALLADLLPGLVVVMGCNRYKAGCLAMERFNPDIFIIDDGFQHLRLKRDFDILLMDAEKPFGNGAVFPAGTMREPLSAVKRADAVVFTRCRNGLHPQLAGVGDLLQIRADHKLAGFRRNIAGEIQDFRELAGKRGVAFAGIADPDAFFNGLEAAGVKLAATLAFPDHTEYGESETAALAKLRKSARADYLITTAKDAVKLGMAEDESAQFYVAALEIDFYEEDLLAMELDKLL